uniref:Olfactory receptor n=1 Tax=Erpetoichthys calabaricus TaxID=27687 RepID=A0A8C4RTY6_ERPCA
VEQKMYNIVGNSSDFILEGFFFPPEARVPLFLLTLFGYIIIVFLNVMLFLVIILHKNLHGPMYVLLCNLIMCDLIGSSALMPRLMSDFFVDVKIISFQACIIQAFCIHMYHFGAQLILGAMALDRYVAICNPLRYATIMTPRTLVKLCSIAWGTTFALVIVLLLITIRLPKCKSLIVQAYCFCGALFPLACGDYSVNNIYGLFVTYLTFAIQTCASHLTVYIIFETALLFSVMALRFPNVNPNLTKTFGTVMITVPPCLNPLIYGINTKEIRNTVLKYFNKKILSC